MIPAQITIKNNELPDSPGVYFYFAEDGQLLYIGKATSLKRRVGSYFTKAHDARLSEMISRIARIDYVETPTVIEALVLEANQIKAKKPKYNILQRDDKSFLYLVITNESFPKPKLVRGRDLDDLGIDPFEPKLSKETKKKFLRVFGPYTSSRSLKMALDLIRPMIPWSMCVPPSSDGKKRPCFDASIGRCPGVCTGEIDRQNYLAIIKNLILFFEGKKSQVARKLKKEMEEASKVQDFEKARRLRDQIFALEHIRDVALIGKSDEQGLPYARIKSTDGIDLEGRIEAYDISNISGTSAVGSMVVFEDGQPNKDAYRKFRIKTVKGVNDVAMLKEVLTRRLKRAITQPNAWPLPEVFVIDGGEPQMGMVWELFEEFGIDTPVLGIAKGFDRKQDRLVYKLEDKRIQAIATRGKEVFQKARDEAHRFAVSYHRKLRGRNLLGK